MSRTLRPTAKSPNRPPTISIVVISHRGRVDHTTAAFHLLIGGCAEPRLSPGEGLNGTIIAPLASPGDDLIPVENARYGTGTVRLPACNPHPNQVDHCLPRTLLGSGV